MPEKIGKEVWIIIIAIPFFATLAKSLSAFNQLKCSKFHWKDFVIQLICGTISGFLFGLLALWLIDNVLGAFALSGFGAVAGITGIGRLSEVMINWLIDKYK